MIIDPASGADYSAYSEATAITPNRLETSRAVGREIVTPDDAFTAGSELRRRLRLEHVFVTLDSEGGNGATPGGTGAPDYQGIFGQGGTTGDLTDWPNDYWNPEPGAGGLVVLEL